jgi:hypothetical protein
MAKAAKKTELTKVELLSTLKKNGFHDIKEMTSTKFAVLVANTSVRLPSLKRVENIFKTKYNVKFDRSTNISSIGHLVIDDKFIITAKPKNRQGTASAGVDNEVMMVNEINNAIKDSDDKTITVIFKHGGGASFKLTNVTEVVRAGADTAGRKKSDVNIISKGKMIPVSLKKDNAENWESADSYWGETARKYVDAAVEKGYVKLEQEGKVFKITPNLAVKSTKDEKTSVVFGSDILPGKGAVIKKTFAKEDFKFDGKKNELTIKVNEIIRDLSDIEGSPSDVWFLIRNDRTRLGSPIGYPGLRVLAVYASRVNNNVKKMNRNDIK